jgi:hypothetical protein
VERSKTGGLLVSSTAEPKGQNGVRNYTTLKILRLKEWKRQQERKQKTRQSTGGKTGGPIMESSIAER